GRPVDPSFPLFHSISNVIYALVFGYHFSDEDKTFHELISATKNLFRFAGSFIHQVQTFTLNLRLEFLINSNSEVLLLPPLFTSLLQKSVALNLLFCFFIEFYSKKGNQNVGVAVNLSTNLSDEGSTIQVTQKKVQKELDAVLDPSQLICYEDQRKLPYTNAVAREIQHFSNIFFVGMPSVCVGNTTLLSFPVKKVQKLWFNNTSSTYKLFFVSEPEAQHFLQKESNFLPDTHCPSPLPSAGHRVCLGEHLARTKLFIFFANLLRAFTFRLPEGVTKISTEPILGGTLQPHPYKVCAIPR
ncbi:CP2DS protein, partial [Anseranas semipalmata]|nr:CP2DS protein [Anseranas semipalmata]